jgi:hypothetical protein
MFARFLSAALITSLDTPPHAARQEAPFLQYNENNL